ncbi:MAG: hypothetical protein AB8C02_16820 [Halioglobus sp.]
MKIKIICALFFGTLLFNSSLALAVIQQHSFTLTGNNGETGNGQITWDDVVVPDGNVLNTVDVISVVISLTGGNVVGGSTSFTLADCTFASGTNTPDFAIDLNFECDDGTNDLFPNANYSTLLNGGPSTITFTPGATVPFVADASRIPTASGYALALLIFGLMLIGVRAVR